MVFSQSDRSFLTILDEAFSRHADHVCISCKGETHTYAEVDRKSARIANVLLEHGFKPGMKGAVYALNSADGFIATIGIIRLGGVWVPVNPRNPADENVAAMLNLECQAVFYEGIFAAPVAEMLGKSTLNPIKVCLNDLPGELPYLADWIKAASEVTPEIAIKPSDLLSIPLTGGTTGVPKGVMLNDANFCALDYFMSTFSCAREHPVWLCAAPMTHAGGRIALSSMSLGGTFVILDKVDPQEILQTIEREKITDMFLPPTAIYSLLDQPNVQDFDLTSLKQIGYASAPIAIDQLKEAIRIFGPVMVGGFGQTECPMSISSLRQEEHFVGGELAPDKRLASVGRATPISTIAILDDCGKEQPAGEPGEIAVKGPMVSPGYYNNPEETAKVRLNGWHLTGDIGYLDEDGFLYIVDRKKDMIISGGFNVYSAEVERCLMGMPSVTLAIVIGIPSEKWGEEVRAQVILEEGASLSKAHIIAYAKERLGSVKAPKNIEFVEDFPRTSIGKIDKKKIRARYWNGLDKKI